MNELMLLPSAGKKGEEAAKGVSFDGVNDYLSRSSDLVGNTNSTTFTFSCWVYHDGSGTAYVYRAFDGSVGDGFVVVLSSTGFRFQCDNTSGSIVLAMDFILKPTNTWINLLFSIDLSNAGNRHVYVNDSLVTANFTTYSNQPIDFTKAEHRIGGDSGSLMMKGRLSNLFLAYEYVDLSVESNRRMFITADGKPA